MPPTPKTTAKARAARAEKAKKKQPKPFEFRGVKLQGPPDLPGTLEFDMGDIMLRAESGDEQGATVGLHRLLEGALGREQLLKVRPTIKGTNDFWQRALLSALFTAYGVDAGEASASAKS